MVASFDRRQREREGIVELGEGERDVFIIHLIIFGVLIHLMIFTIISQIASCTNFNMLHCGGNFLTF